MARPKPDRRSRLPYRIRYRTGEYLVRALVAILGRLPASARPYLAWIVERASYLLLWRFRQRMRDTLQRTMGEELPTDAERRAVVRGAWRNFSHGLVESFATLAVRDEWYTPWGGPPAVRSLAGSGADVYADIHVGSIMRSADRGVSWKPVTPDLHQDVHQVAVCPAAPERVYANTANAVFVSGDRGQSWEHRSGGLPSRYGRAVAVHPSDPDCLLASVSRGPHAEGTGKLFRSDDAGRSWTHVRDGFPPAARDNVDTFHVAFDAAGAAWAAVEERLYRSGDRGRRWEAVWSASSDIRAVCCAAAP